MAVVSHKKGETVPYKFVSDRWKAVFDCRFVTWAEDGYHDDVTGDIVEDHDRSL